MTRRNGLRILLPMSLVAVGVYLLAGCIPLPGDYRNEDGGPRPENQNGRAGDQRLEWSDFKTMLAQPRQAPPSAAAPPRWCTARPTS